MTDTLMKLLAFVIMVGFLAILVIYVPRLDLGIVVLITLALAGWDFFGPKRG